MVFVCFANLNLQKFAKFLPEVIYTCMQVQYMHPHVSQVVLISLVFPFCSYAQKVLKCSAVTVLYLLFFDKTYNARGKSS